jgi:hypothetical protein
VTEKPMKRSRTTFVIKLRSEAGSEGIRISACVAGWLAITAGLA